jgi:hypothetical protein
MTKRASEGAKILSRLMSSLWQSMTLLRLTVWSIKASSEARAMIPHRILFTHRRDEQGFWESICLICEEQIPNHYPVREESDLLRGDIGHRCDYETLTDRMSRHLPN